MNLIKASLENEFNYSKFKVTIGENEVNLMAYYPCFHLMWLNVMLAEIHGLFAALQSKGFLCAAQH